jgi:multiple sugar transport system substrate-binding protein
MGPSCPRRGSRATEGAVVIDLPDDRNRRYLRKPFREGGDMLRVSAWLSFSLCVILLLSEIGDAAQTEPLIFLSTQLRPIEEAQKMRNLILKDFSQEVDYITEEPQQFPERIKEERQGGTHTIDVVGALHGELRPLGRAGCTGAGR